MKVLNSSTNNRQLFNRNSEVAWIADDPKTSDKYLAVFNIADQVEAEEKKSVWNSGVINKETISQSKTADIDITGARKLYLVVTDAGDDIAWDHADWISPTLYNDKDSLLLTSLKWLKATAGWQEPRLDTSVSGSELIVNGKAYANGIGTHSNSVIEYDLPQGYTHFKTMAGLDNAGTVQSTGATVKFLIYTKNPAGPAPADSTHIKVSLKEIGIAHAKIIDLWTGKDKGDYSGSFSPAIKRHSCGFYKLSVIK